MKNLTFHWEDKIWKKNKKKNCCELFLNAALKILWVYEDLAWRGTKLFCVSSSEVSKLRQIRRKKFLNNENFPVATNWSCRIANWIAPKWRISTLYHILTYWPALTCDNVSNWKLFFFAIRVCRQTWLRFNNSYE